jgi:hypothetical protein
VWGTIATSDEFTGNFGSALENTSIGDCRLTALFAEKSLQAIFGVLQHYPLNSGHAATNAACPFGANIGSRAASSGAILRTMQFDCTAAEPNRSGLENTMSRCITVLVHGGPKNRTQNLKPY